MKMSRPSAEDQQPLELTPDRNAETRALVRKAQEHLAMLTFFLDNGEITRYTAESPLRLAESEISKIGKLLGVDTESAAKIEERHGDIRRANMRIRELEGLLAQSVPPEAIQPALRKMARHLNSWWDFEGFGHISDTAFGEYNLKVDFCCQFIGVKPYIPNSEQLSRKERWNLWLVGLRERGFVLLDDEDSEKGILDCPESRQALRKLFESRFSGFHIVKFDSRESERGSHLTSVEVVIRNIEDILQLPLAPTDQAAPD
ncbi:hypothetical protein ACYPKM_01410 [Pseudomonas aeruginosa]